jgi:molybdate transport system ATP-binding protein
MSLDARLVVRRGRFTVDVEFAVADGEVLGVLGPNGAGKTSALRALAGLEPLADGHVTLDGQDLTRRRPEDRYVGVVFQDYLLFPHLTALDNVAYGLRAGGMRKATARRDAAGWLEQVGLTERTGHRPRQLSGGQGQRVALARALAARPRLLLLDEPSLGLAPRVTAEVFAALAGLRRERGLTLLLVEQNARLALDLVDDAAVVEAGRLTLTGPAAEVAGDDAVRRAYLGV